MTKPKKPRNLYTFGNTLKDGKLYLFQPNELVVIRGWPEMRAWRRTPVRAGWTHVRPELQLIPNNGTFQTTRRDSDWLANVCPHDVPRQAPDAADSWLRTRDLPALFRQAAPFCAFELEQIGEALLHKDLTRMFEFLAPFPCMVVAATFPFKQRQWHLAQLRSPKLKTQQNHIPTADYFPVRHYKSRFWRNVLRVTLPGSGGRLSA